MDNPLVATIAPVQYSSRDMSASSIVNLDRYPIGDLNTGAARQFVQQCHQVFAETGLCVLPDFVRPQALSALAGEANAISGHAYFCKSTHNAYLTEDDSGLPADHVRRKQEPTFVGSVAYDRIPDESALRCLYQWDPLKDFIGAMLGKTPFYRFGDPLGACSINVFVDGGEHGWHFDESEFTVTLMLQPPEHGGAFEYVPQIRGRPDEEECVARALSGDRSGVVELPFTAGTLLVFGGRQTLHRVTRVSGSRPRLVPVLCYSERPGLTNSDAVRKLFWGRTGNESSSAR